MMPIGKTPASLQPRVAFYAEIELSHVLNLADPAVLKSLNLHPAALLLPWRTAPAPTETQLLGQAVEQSRSVAAIRYPSKAAANIGHDGCNVVIFQNNVVCSPDFVRIFGPEKDRPLQSWP